MMKQTYWAIVAGLLGICPAQSADITPLKTQTTGFDRVAPIPLGWSTSFNAYQSSRDTNTTDINSSAKITQSGGRLALNYAFERVRIAMHGSIGKGHLYYEQVLQDTYQDSLGYGLTVAGDYGPMTLKLGLSGAQDRYKTVLQTSSDSWQGQELAVHGVLEGHFNPIGLLWFEPQIGARALNLHQGNHLLGVSIVPPEMRSSDMIFAGFRAVLDFKTPQGDRLAPWLLLGATREFNRYAPMNPSVFLNGPEAGNAYTLFPANSLGAPSTFPAHNSGVVGVGLDVHLSTVLVLNAAYLHEYNQLYRGESYKVGLRINW
jgi:hypothetical protein